MKFVCRFRTMLRGDLVKVGQVVDLSESEQKLGVVKRNFVPVESSGEPEQAAPASSTPAPVVVAGLTREQAIMKLNQAGQRVSPRISDERLAQRFEEFFQAQQ